MIVYDNFNGAHFKVYAAADVECGGREYVKASTDRGLTADGAEDIAAQFPKSIGLRVHRFIGRAGVPESCEVELHANLCPNRSDQGVNEGGVKRYRSFREHAARLGHKVDDDPAHSQSSPDIISSETDFGTAFGLFGNMVRRKPGYGIRRRARPGLSASDP